MSILLSEQNNERGRGAVAGLILDTAQEMRPHTLTPHFEHGHWWATCLCGAAWSVEDCEPGPLELEQVSEGDDDYHNEEG